MCRSLKTVWVPNGSHFEKTAVPCGKCWSCRQNRLANYVGRALCESAYSASCCTVTLTYRDRDDGAEKVLDRTHFQKFIRALRRRKLLVRYLAAGEYGELRGRAHFHACLFFKDKSPRELPFQIPQKQICHVPEIWPHGHIRGDWTKSPAAIRYVAKYLQKENGNSWMSLSKKPILGAAFIADFATRYVEADCLPPNLSYSPPAGGNRMRYALTGKSEILFLRFIDDAAPHLLQRPPTQWMEGAIRRYRQHRQEETWKAIVLDEDPDLTAERAAREKSPMQHGYLMLSLILSTTARPYDLWSDYIWHEDIAKHVIPALGERRVWNAIHREVFRRLRVEEELKRWRESGIANGPSPLPSSKPPLTTFGNHFPRIATETFERMQRQRRR